MEWFENDELWAGLFPFLFDKERSQAAPGEVDGAERLLELQPGARILDLGCGAGRHCLELARRGYAVTGVDRTALYLEHAARTARERGVEVDFVLSDMREFRRPSAFDAAINMYTSFGYFADPRDDLRVLANLRDSLVDGGRLLMETTGKEILARIFQARDWQEAEDGTLWLLDREVSDGWSRMAQRWISLKEGRRAEYNFTHRLFSGWELAEMLRRAGFRDVRLFGSVAGAPYDRQALRLVVTGRK